MESPAYGGELKSLEMVRILRKIVYNGKKKELKIKLQNALIFKEWASGEKLRKKIEKDWVGKREIRTDRARETKMTEIV